MVLKVGIVILYRSWFVRKQASCIGLYCLDKLNGALSRHTLCAGQ
jgi:hypothetical protein